MYYGVWVDNTEDSGFSFKSNNRAAAMEAYRSETDNALARGYKRVRLLEVGANEITLVVVDEWTPEDPGSEA